MVTVLLINLYAINHLHDEKGIMESSGYRDRRPDVDCQLKPCSSRRDYDIRYQSSNERSNADVSELGLPQETEQIITLQRKVTDEYKKTGEQRWSLCRSIGWVYKQFIVRTEKD